MTQNSFSYIRSEISTVIDSDKILALSKGKVMDFDKPSTLLSDRHKDNVFKQLVEETGVATSSYLKRVANGEMSVFDRLEIVDESESNKIVIKKKKDTHDHLESHRKESHIHSPNKNKPRKKRNTGKIESMEIKTEEKGTIVSINQETNEEEQEQEEHSEIVEEYENNDS
jgi:hypothetical protein